MSDFLKAVFLSFVMFILGLGVFWIGLLPKGVGHNQSPASAPTLAKPAATVAATQSPSPVIIQARGPYRVQGNAILGADGNRYLFHGIGRDGLEYSCWGDGHFDAQELSYLGAGTTTSSVTYWGANTVRLPLSEGIWLHGQPRIRNEYQKENAYCPGGYQAQPHRTAHCDRCGQVGDD